MARATFLLSLLASMLLTCSPTVDSARILIIPLQAKSHMFYMNAVGEGLLERGHEVYTVMGSHFPEPKDLVKLGFHILRFPVPKDALTLVSPQVLDIMRENFMAHKESDILPQLQYEDCERMLEDSFLQNLRNLKFDIAAIDGFPIAPCGFIIPHVLGIPHVFISSGNIPWLMRVPAPPSFVPALLFPYGDDMSFVQRLKNTLPILIMGSGLMMPPSMCNHTLIEKYSQDPTLHTWKDVIRRSELFLITRGNTLEWPEPSMPNVILLEGLTIRPAQPLPPGDIQKFVQQSPTDIIVVSFGSILGAFPEEINEKLMAVFAERKEHFVWRLPGKITKDMVVPPNVKLVSWLPQNEILAHPKTKLFITHCGNNGQYEAVYHGVPMIGFPIFGDQEHNCGRLTLHKFGLSGDLRTFSVKELLYKIEDIMSKPVYRDNVKRASLILKDAPQNARNISAYWIEHVIKFGGKHLRSRGMDMPAYQYLMVDVFLCLGAIIVVVIFSFKCMVCWLCSGLMGKKEKSTDCDSA